MKKWLATVPDGKLPTNQKIEEYEDHHMIILFSILAKCEYICGSLWVSFYNNFLSHV